MTSSVQPKSWWQTFAGLLTGFSALLTAIAGLLVALKQTGMIGAEHCAPEVSELAAPARSIPEKPSLSVVSRDRSLTPAAQYGLHRERVAVELPGKREYVLGATYNHTRFTLLESSLEPQTAESNVLTLKVRVTAEGRDDSRIDGNTFTLLLGDESVSPKSVLGDIFPAGEFRERTLRFVIEHRVTDATLRIESLYGYSAEIPLSLPASTVEK